MAPPGTIRQFNKSTCQKRKVEIKYFAAPPNSCWPICETVYHDVCMEDYAVKRDCSQFEPNEVFELSDLPRFLLQQWQQKMTPKERQSIAGDYLAKIADYLQGRQPVYLSVLCFQSLH